MKYGWCHHCQRVLRDSDLEVVDGPFGKDRYCPCGEPWTLGIFSIRLVVEFPETEEEHEDGGGALWVCVAKHVGEQMYLGSCGCPEQVEAVQKEKDLLDEYRRRQRSEAAKRGAETRRRNRLLKQ